MKSKIFAICALMLFVPFIGMAQKKNKKSNEATFSLTSNVDSLSYALGVSILKNLKAQGLDTINLNAFQVGIENASAGKPLLMSPEEANVFLSAYFSSLQAKKSEGKIKEGKTFLALNKSKEGVKETASGLQYKVIKQGTGPKPSSTDMVKTHYHGTLPDGTVFDSSVERGEPITFPLNGVIKGWTEALQLMPVGSKYQLFIPSELGYGDQGAGGVIQAHQVLIFEVELLSIEPKQE